MKTTTPLDYRQLMAAAAEFVAEERPQVESPAALAALLRPLTQTGIEQEHFWVILLNAKNRVCHIHLATLGLVDRAQVHAREIFREAIRHSASRIVLAHNHPSGDPTPSPQDIACTRSMVEAGKIIGIDVLDHVVLGHATASRPKDFLSLREENLM